MQWLLRIAEYEVAGTLVWNRWYVTLNWNLCCPSKNVLIWLTLVTNSSTSFGATKPRWRAMHGQCTELVFAFHSLLRRLKRSWLVTYCFRGCFFPRFVQKCCDAVSAIPMNSYRDKSLDGSAVCSENLSSQFGSREEVSHTLYISQQAYTGTNTIFHEKWKKNSFSLNEFEDQQNPFGSQNFFFFLVNKSIHLLCPSFLFPCLSLPFRQDIDLWISVQDAIRRTSTTGTQQHL